MGKRMKSLLTGEEVGSEEVIRYVAPCSHRLVASSQLREYENNEIELEIYIKLTASSRSGIENYKSLKIEFSTILIFENNILLML